MWKGLVNKLMHPAGGNAAAGAGTSNLWIGGHPESMRPVDDPQGLGGYQLAVEGLIREESPEIIYLYSDDPHDLSVVRKALAYLSRIGGEVAVAWQLPDAEVAGIFGLLEREYQSVVMNPNGSAVALAG